MTDRSWFASIAPIMDAPMIDAPLTTGDWSQDSRYTEPLWAEHPLDIVERLSIDNNGFFYSLCEIGPGVSDTLDTVLRLGHWHQRTKYRLSCLESQRPVEQGYLRFLRFRHDSKSPEQPTDAASAIRAFCNVEHTRIPDMEPWLRDFYQGKDRSDPRFDWIDFPVFDCGTGYLGFVVLTHGHELCVWSRVAHAHK